MSKELTAPEGALSSATRAKYGFLCATLGIVVNVILFAIKFLAGVLTGSLAVSADAFNNLSDAASSIISLITFRIASKPADRDHPFGHARIEYVSSMIVSFFIILVGYELVKSAIQKIITPTITKFSWLAIAILVVAILAKLILFFINRHGSKKINSEVLNAASVDSLCDAIATSVVLLSAILAHTFDIALDGYMGLLVAGFILFAGVKVLNETKNSILGEAPVKETITAIEGIIRRYPEVMGIHDLTVHSYGPLHTMASFHAEVDGSVDVFATHDVIDNIERTIKEELNIDCSIHMDPIVVGDEMVDQLRGQVEEIVHSLGMSMKIHDFRCVIGQTHTNLIFDVDVPFEVKLRNQDIITLLQGKVKDAMGENVFVVATIDRN